MESPSTKRREIESEKQGVEEFEDLGRGFLFLVACAFEGPATNLGPCGR